ncbi:hypothetical protein ACFE04_025763 [Oxalis oulophora]
MTFNRSLKRMKRNSNRVTADHHSSHLYYYHDFFTFPSTATVDPFRVAVQTFLSDHARVTCAPSLFPSLMTWQVVFRLGDLTDGGVVVLDIVEEDVTRSTSGSVYCDQCRVVDTHIHIHGKGNNAAINGYQSYSQSCPRCGCQLLSSDYRCRHCNIGITTDDLDDWISSQFEDNTHLLHGVVHSNGHGHLLTVNGREGGSRLLSGYDIMNFWDRLCTTLSVRKVTVMDMSKKRGMEYRLLHAITKGHSWYGNWGYELKSGSYAITQDEYRRSVDILSSIPLSSLFQGRGHRSSVEDAVSYYQFLSETELRTTKDLFSFMLKLIHQTKQKSTKRSKCELGSSNKLCAWTTAEIECIQQGMIKVLSASGARWVSRRALKGAMCQAGSPELLDYCLKHLGGRLVADRVMVQAKSNPNLSDIEFRLELLQFNVEVSVGTNYPSVERVKTDLKFLYDHLVHPETMANYKPQALRERAMDSATKLLDCKQLMKDYKLDQETIYNPIAIHLWCQVELADQNEDDPVPPPELIVLPLDATVADLKILAANTFQDVYAMFQRFEVEKLLEYGSVDNSIGLKLLVGSFGWIQIRGRCPSKQGLIRFCMERGTEEWTVDCICGARDDDGERMLACDRCVKPNDGVPESEDEDKLTPSKCFTNQRC